MKKFTLLLLLLAFVYSCQKSENPAPEENEDNIPPAPAEIVISDNYLPLTQQNSTCTAYDTLSGAVEMYISDTTLVPQMGNVIVVDLDTLGAIRRITSVENLSSGSYRFTTEHATMGDIFEKGHFAISTSNETSTKAGIPVYTPDRIIYIGDGEQNNTKGQITKRLLEAEVPLGEKRVWEKDDDNYISFTDESNISSSLDLVMEFNFDNIQQIAHNYKHNLIEFKAYLEGDVKTDAGLRLEINGKYEEEIERELKKNILKPVAYWTTVRVGLIPVPVFVTCTTDLLSDASLTVEGNFGASVEASYSLNGKSGFQYQQSTNKITSFNEVTESVETFPPTITAEISIENKASVFPRVSVFLYGRIGPIIEMKPYFAQNAKGSVEVKLTDKKDKVGAALTYSASIGMDICGKLHLDPFGDGEKVEDIEVMDLQLFEKEIYRSPHKIEKKEVKTAEGGEKKVVFEVYDTLAAHKKVVPTTIPIPVVITKSSTVNKQSSDNSSAPVKESFEVKRVAEGKIEVPVDKNASVVEEVKQTINADIYSDAGTVISNASHTEVVESDLREILIAFYESTDGDNWTRNDNWCSDEPIDTWYGVYINGENNLLSLYLRENNLRGDALLLGCTSLAVLDCYNNPLTGLDVSGCTSLYSLSYCDLFNRDNYYNHLLTSLNVSGCTSLKELYIRSNQLKSLDANGCTSLVLLICDDGQLTTFDLSGCTSLKTISCPNNQLVTLDLNSLTSLEEFNCSNNQLTALDLEGCTSLKEFYYYDNQLVTLNLKGCTSLTDFELYPDDNQRLSLATLDLSGCTSLKKLVCRNNQLTSLKVDDCVSLEEIDCSNNHADGLKNGLTVLDLSDCSSLEELYCSNNQLIALDLRGCSSLTRFSCSGNKLTKLDLSGFTSLKVLWCEDNQLTSLGLVGCSSLEELYCSNNQLTVFDVSGCTSLEIIRCVNNQLTALDLNGLTSLEDLDFNYNTQLTRIDLTDCSSLVSFNYNTFYYNKVPMLNTVLLKNCTSLESVVWENTQLTTLDLSDCSSLEKLYCSNNQLTTLNLTNCTSLALLYCDNNQLTTLDLSLSNCSSLKTIDCYNNQLTALDLRGCASLTWLSCSRNKLTKLDLNGFTSLKELQCSNNQLTSLGLVGCSSLEKLYCQDNQLKVLDLTDCISFDIFAIYWLENNPLTTINFTGCSSLSEFVTRDFYGGYKNITTLLFTNCTSLKRVDWNEGNNLKKVDFSGCTSLTYVDCSKNMLSEISLKNCSALETLNIEYNEDNVFEVNLDDCLSIKRIDCTEKCKATGEIPTHLFGKNALRDYERRYSYIWDKITHEDGSWSEVFSHYIDKGYGWWYPGEPDSHEHGY